MDKKLNPRILADRLKQLGIDDKGKRILKAYILKQQDYKCAICGKDLRNAEPRDIQLDHSHKPPFEIRGVLCQFCNKYMLTKTNEHRPELFLNAYNYLTADKAWIDDKIKNITDEK